MSLPEFWFVLIGVLFTGYFVLEGFDFGVGMLMGILGRGGDEAADTRRRVLLNTIGPVWDGNEVWVLTAGGAMFAAFPEWYATLFSGFYIPLLLILVALIVRVVAIEYRGKIDDPQWRRRWDYAIIFGSFMPALLWGVAFANIVRGVAIDENKQVTSSLIDLLNPYGLLGGLTTLFVFLLHGTVFAALKSGGGVRSDAIKLAQWLSIPTTVIAGIFVLWTQFEYGKGWTWLMVLIAAGCLVGVVALTRVVREGLAFALTSVAIAATSVLLFGSLFPNVMPSSTDPAYSLTIENASSTHYTLVVMSWVAVILVPLVLIYQGWTYWVFRQRISAEQIPPSIGLPLQRR
ncbi:cytochrome d ubiquinol oxidase subunit II [Aldersonia sp. NBC_00410]|uniref:cytochrome d ubiquinol oxidase subunit II n=1 Tax=Aldersonia sp. NBC_00410 TaxID=2975954 RepID=UPI00224F8324|nr:cytochrome d ubiquinol oxidase subunit II [Aldersonia sp. NBC_00410]MCX5043440.1 cytochrome d ubiquinol oxidase subunit II [Aldersonia sp. NBC_00410]